MSHNHIHIETMGYIKKEASLTTVENNIVPETLVLESLYSYPGYYGENQPEKPCPRSLFLIVDKTYSLEEIARITAKVKKEFTHDFDMSYGNIYLKRKTYACIRIKYLKSFHFIPELQALLQDYQVKFLKKKALDEKGIIVIHKNFYVQEMEEGIYSDFEEVKSYLELPVNLSWENFSQLTHDIKNNLTNNNFDAAQGIFFRKKGIVDVIRVYDCQPGYERFKMIRKMYLERIKKEM
jgi:virulence-associated protein VapD